MVYKKYIKRGNKLHGPYFYRSRRVGNRVITEYVGKHDNEEQIIKNEGVSNVKNKPKSSWIKLIFPVIILLAIVTLLLFFNIAPTFTGRAALQLSPSYQINEQIFGNLNLKLKKGELIPAGSVVRVKLGSQEKEFLLSELVDLSTNDGSFYAENTDLSGSGSGYGFIGKKTSAPVLDFTILVYEEKEEKEKKEEEETAPTPPPEEETVEEEETPPTPPPEEEIIEEEPEVVEEAEETEEEPESSPITGGVIKEEKEKEKKEKIISGTVRAGEIFEYKLKEGETADIVEGSVNVNGEQISGSVLETEIIDNTLKITTDYTSEEQGFGEEYLTDETGTITINLEDLDITAEPGLLDIEIVSNNKILTSSSKEIVVEGVEEIPEEPEEIPENITEVNVTTNITEIPENISEINVTKIPENITEVNVTEVNVTITIPENITANITELNITEAIIENITNTNITETNLTLLKINETVKATIITQQYNAKVLEPVKWKKSILLDKEGAITVELPNLAGNITVYKITGELIEEMEIPITEPGLPESEPTPTEPGEEIIPEIGRECNDSDGGNNMFIKGSVVYKGKEYEDYCYDNLRLKEYYCDAFDEIKTERHKCSYGCKNGACLEAKKPECVDSDNGLDYSTKGEICINGDCKQDICLDENYVSEGYCKNKYKTDLKIYKCKYKCEEGVCIPKPAETEKVRERTKIREEIPEEKIIVTGKTITGEVISGKISADIELGKEPAIIRFFKNLFRTITGRVITTASVSKITEITIDDNATQYEIEYHTPEAYVYEEEIARGKKITVSGPEELHYINITAYTTLSSEVSEEKIRLYHLTAQGREQISVDKYDTNANGLIDYVEWTVLSLSNESYELIIEISKAEHLNENKTFISDIYEQVKALDNIWSEPIYHNEYVRVVFEENLTSDKDITLYARNLQSSSTLVEVYEYEANNLLSSFPVITNEAYYTIYLTNLTNSQDTFDLKIRNLDNNSNAYLEFDYIIDPIVTYYPNLTGGAAWTGYSTTKPSTTLNILTETAYSAANLAKISVDDNNYVATTLTIADTYPAHRLQFKLSEIGENINNITIGVKGYGQDYDSGFGWYVYVWNHTSSDYSALAANANGSASLLENFTAFPVDLVNDSGHLYLTIYPQPVGIGEEPHNYLYYAYLEVSKGDEYPAFNNEWTNNGTLLNTGTALFNITLASTNGTVFLVFDTNKTRYAAENISATSTNVFNVSVDIELERTYAYYWESWGNGSILSHNISRGFYTVNASPPNIQFVNPTPANNNLTDWNFVELNVSIPNTRLGNMTLNWNGTNYTIYNDSLLLMMNFDNITGIGESYTGNGTNVVDLSRYSYNGTWRTNNTNEGTKSNWTSAGKYGGAFNFDGKDDYITLGDTLELGTANFTVEAWIKRNNLDSQDVLLMKWVGTGGERAFWFAISDSAYAPDTDKIQFGISADGTNTIPYVYGSSNVSAEVWHHIAVVKSGTEARLYLDGSYDGNGTTYASIANTAVPWGIGGGVRINGESSGSVFNGTIDEVRIWNRSLSAEEINQSYKTNLYRYSEANWALYANESSLSAENWTSYACATNSKGQENCTEERTFQTGFTGAADTTFPLISITAPSNNSNHSSAIVDVNYTVGDAYIDACWYTNTSSVSNITITCGTNLSQYIWFEGVNNISIYANDTAGNTNSSHITFYIDTTAPNLSISYPENTTYAVNVSVINYTSADAQNCWYSLNNGTTNSTTVLAGINFTSLTSNEGSNTWSVYCNDTSDNLNSSSVTFFKDTIYPTINITTPQNNTNTSNTGLEINYTVADANLNACWWTNSSGEDNKTLTCGDNVTGQTWPEGSNTVIIYVNDTANNENSTSLIFTIDTTAPNISISYPENTSYASSIIILNYTVSGDATSCMYFNGTINGSMTCGDNVTAISSEGGNTWLVYANDSSQNQNSSSITFIVDISYPEINISYPTNTTYSGNISWLNYTITETNPDSCWFTNSSGLVNITTTCGANFTALNASEGSNTWTMYINDSAGNENYTSIAFVVDTLPPQLSNIVSTEEIDRATITWDTNEPANYTIYYGTTIAVTSNVSSNSFNTGHSKELTSLSEYTLYYFNISACDSLNNCNNSVRQYEFRTGTTSGGGGGCADLCLEGGEEKSCINSTTLQTRTCGNYDDDTCREWSGWTEMGCSDECVNDECAIVCVPEWDCTVWSECAWVEGDGGGGGETTITGRATLGWAVPITGVILGTDVDVLRLLVLGSPLSLGDIGITGQAVGLPDHYVISEEDDIEAVINKGDVLKVTYNKNLQGLAVLSVERVSTELSVKEKETHTIIIDEISTSNVKVTISSTPITRDVNLGQTETFDFTETSPEEPTPSPAPSSERWWLETRTCTDLNNCGVEEGKPEESRECEEECIETWTCTGWTGCTEHLQTRTCEDVNNCGTTEFEPEEQQECNNPPIIEQYIPGDLSLTAKKGTINFNIEASDEDQDTLTVTWILDGQTVKSQEGDSSSYSLDVQEEGNYLLRVQVTDNQEYDFVTWHIEVISEECEDEWNCSEWGECEEGLMRYKNCEKVNPECPLNMNKPSTEWKDPDCIKEYACTPQWNISEWSGCAAEYSLKDLIESQNILKGKQERSWIDLDECLEPRVEKRACNLSIPVEASKVKWCDEDYVEVREKETNKLVSRIRRVQVEDTTRVDIGLITTEFAGYCEYCYDGIKNYDEESLDCGGPSCPACLEYAKGYNYWKLLSLLLWILLIVLIVSYLGYMLKGKIKLRNVKKLKKKIRRLKKR